MRAECDATGSCDPQLVISQAHYDPPDWVDLVTRNALQFTEPSTFLILHLNALSDYSPGTILRWHRTPRVRVARRRIPVRWGTGSLTLAHALSALEAFKTWPSCSHFLLQASNMLWIRRGMELPVRRLGCSVSPWVIAAPNNFLRKAMRHPFTKAMIPALSGGDDAHGSHQVQDCSSFLHLLLPSLILLPLNSHTMHCYKGSVNPLDPHPWQVWHYHEGSFYPLQTVVRFARHMLQWFTNATAGRSCLNIPDCTRNQLRIMRGFGHRALSLSGRFEAAESQPSTP